MSTWTTGFLAGAVIATALILWIFGNFIIGLVILAMKVLFVVALAGLGLYLLVKRLLKGPNKI